MGLGPGPSSDSFSQSWILSGVRPARRARHFFHTLRSIFVRGLKDRDGEKMGAQEKSL